MNTRPTAQARKTSSRAWLAKLVAALIIFHSAAALSDDSQEFSRLPWRKHRLDFNLGIFFPTIASSVRLESESGLIGGRIDLEEEAKLDGFEKVIYLDGTFRIADRHALNFGYFELNRNGTAIASAEIPFGDISIGANARFDTEFDTKVLRLGYEYAILIRDTWELALLAGVHFTSLDVSVNSETLGVSESASAEAPLPTLGFKNYFSYTDDLYLKLAVEWISLDIENIAGTITNLTAVIQYNFNKNIGVGGGYVSFDIGIDETPSSDNITGSYLYRGPLLYLNVGF
ncbi:MAG: hypothetical protein ABFS45_06055 [Pseudomonadota bacterium]